MKTYRIFLKGNFIYDIYTWSVLDAIAHVLTINSKFKIQVTKVSEMQYIFNNEFCVTELKEVNNL